MRKIGKNVTFCPLLADLPVEICVAGRLIVSTKQLIRAVVTF